VTSIDWSPQAKVDLKSIYLLIAPHNKAAAVKLIEGITGKIALLSRHPRIGVERGDIEPGLRMIAIPPYLVFHEIKQTEQKGESVNILRILDGRRDIKELL
jgi:plasmid stabilization system protein ParE